MADLAEHGSFAHQPITDTEGINVR